MGLVRKIECFFNAVIALEFSGAIYEIAETAFWEEMLCVTSFTILKVGEVGTKWIHIY